MAEGVYRSEGRFRPVDRRRWIGTVPTAAAATSLAPVRHPAYYRRHPRWTAPQLRHRTLVAFARPTGSSLVLNARQPRRRLHPRPPRRHPVPNVRWVGTLSATPPPTSLATRRPRQYPQLNRRRRPQNVPPRTRVAFARPTAPSITIRRRPSHQPKRHWPKLHVRRRRRYAPSVFNPFTADLNPVRIFYAEGPGNVTYAELGAIRAHDTPALAYTETVPPSEFEQTALVFAERP